MVLLFVFVAIVVGSVVMVLVRWFTCSGLVILVRVVMVMYWLDALMLVMIGSDWNWLGIGTIGIVVVVGWVR